MWAAFVFRFIHSNGRYGSARVGVSGPKEGDKVREQGHAWGTLGGTQYRNTVRKIGKYRNTVSKIDY